MGKWFINFCAPFRHDVGGTVDTSRVIMTVCVLILLVVYLVMLLVYRLLGSNYELRQARSNSRRDSPTSLTSSGRGQSR